MSLMNEQKYTYRVQWMVLIGAALLLVLLLGAWISEGLNKEWRSVQKEYSRILDEINMENGAPPGEFEKGIFQVDLPQFHRSDRCISCHHGLENPLMDGKKQPHASHPGTFMEDHPLQDYGCTICHGGQPGALSRKEAFGQAPEGYSEKRTCRRNQGHG